MNNNPFAQAIQAGLGGLTSGLKEIGEKNLVEDLIGLAQKGDQTALAKLAQIAPNTAQTILTQSKVAQAEQQEKQQLAFRKMANMAISARALEDPVKIRAFLQNELRQERDPRIQAEIADTLNMSDDQMLFDLDSAIASAQANLGELIQPKAGKGVQFGAQQTFKDSKGNLFFGTQKRDPTTGRTETTLSPIANAPDEPIGDVNVVGAFGETGREATERRLLEAQAQADIDVETDISKLTGKKREERIDNIIDTGIASVSVMPTYERMLDLVDTVSTGGVQAGLQRARQLFGWEAADLGELDALFKESVLGNIKQLGSNPTEGERRFIVEASGSIGQNPAVLKRLITRRKKQAQSAVQKSLPSLGAAASKAKPIPPPAIAPVAD